MGVRISGQESGWSLACCIQHRTQVVRGGDVGRKRPAWQQVPALLLLVGGPPSGSASGSALRLGSSHWAQVSIRSHASPGSGLGFIGDSFCPGEFSPEVTLSPEASLRCSRFYSACSTAADVEVCVGHPAFPKAWASQGQHAGTCFLSVSRGSWLLRRCPGWYRVVLTHLPTCPLITGCRLRIPSFSMCRRLFFFEMISKS